jgi:hypothetical protein
MPKITRLPLPRPLCPYVHPAPAQRAKANAAAVTKYKMGATENDAGPKPVNCAGAELLVAFAVVFSEPPVPPALFPSSVKLAQVSRVAFPKWRVKERLPKKEPRPSRVDAKSSV